MKKLSLLVLFSVLCCFVANAQTKVFERYYAKYAEGVELPPVIKSKALFNTPTKCQKIIFGIERKGTVTFQGSYVTTCGHFSYDLAPITLTNTESSDISTYVFWIPYSQYGEEYKWNLDVFTVSEQELPWGGTPGDGTRIWIEYQ